MPPRLNLDSETSLFLSWFMSLWGPPVAWFSNGWISLMVLAVLKNLIVPFSEFYLFFAGVDDATFFNFLHGVFS